MIGQVKLKSKDGRAECECPEKYAVALVASGKWIRIVEPELKTEQRGEQK